MNNWYAYNVLVNDRHQSRQRSADRGAATRARRASAARPSLGTRMRGWFGRGPAPVVATPPAIALEGRRPSRADGTGASTLDRVA
jgi:hypothetical protein